MIIRKPCLNWNGTLKPLDKSAVDGIALHHAAHISADAQTIHGWHLEKGWMGFGYNYFVDKDGTVVEGRGLNVAAGVGGKNGHLVSVCFQGDYENKDTVMPTAQIKAGMELVRWLCGIFPGIKRLDGHNAWNSTACPGRHFPLKEMKDFFVSLQSFDNTPSDHAAEAVKKALERGILKGTPDGNLMLKSPLSREDFFVFTDRLGLL